MRVEGYLGDDMREVPNRVRWLEDLGFDRANATEIKHSPLLFLTLAAEHSSRIELGTAISIAFARSPMVMALEAWDLQRYSNGRVAIGLGTQVKGHIEKRYGMPWSKSAGPRMREYIQFMHAAWDSFQHDTKPDFRGEHYTFTIMTPFFNAGPIDPPYPKVDLAAVGSYMCQVAGEVADGLRLHSFTTPKYLKEVQIPAVEKGLAKAGRTRDSLEISAGPWIITGANAEAIEKAKQPVREAIAFYGSTRSYGDVWRIHGMEEMTPRLHEMSLRGEWKAMSELIDDDMLEMFSIIGGPDEIIPQLVEKYGGLIDSVSLGEEDIEGRPGLARNDQALADAIARLHAVPAAGQTAASAR